MGYIGNKEAYPIVIEGLKKLEYRGYDSAGVAIMNGSLSLYKKEGKVKNLEQYVHSQKNNGNIALGHTRWATHGVPNDSNAHPHTSQSGRLVMVHNGIIENYNTLKSFLVTKGYTFSSDTDSEVLIQYIEWYQKSYFLTIDEAVRRALGDVQGSYAIVVLDTEKPQNVIVAKRDNPLVIGIRENEFYIASDVSPIGQYTQNVIYLEDNQIGILSDNGSCKIFNLEGKECEKQITTILFEEDDYTKDGYDSYMLKEIFQQPLSLKASMRNRIKDNKINIKALKQYKRVFKNANRIIIIGCGTSWHAGLIGEHLLESFAHIPTEVEYASEFRYRDPIIKENDLVIAISQSGETADTLAALKLANAKGAFTYSLVNTEGSTIARISDAVSYLNAGIEIGVASTKAFTSQVTLLTMIALEIGQMKGIINKNDYKSKIENLLAVPNQVKEILKTNSYIKNIAEKMSNTTNALFLGRGINFPSALEGALKLKEISYIHAEGYPAAEMKHGPIALIDENMPVIVLANNNKAWQKLISNVQEIKSRKGKVILLKSNSQEMEAGLADYVINLPVIDDFLSPIISSIPLQLFSYHSAKIRECNVDQPRNLAKSVTVE